MHVAFCLLGLTYHVVHEGTLNSDLPRVGGSVGTSGNLEITSSSSSGLLTVLGSSPCTWWEIWLNDLSGFHNILVQQTDY